MIVLIRWTKTAFYQKNKGRYNFITSLQSILVISSQNKNICKKIHYHFSIITLSVQVKMNSSFVQARLEIEYTSAATSIVEGWVLLLSPSLLSCYVALTHLVTETSPTLDPAVIYHILLFLVSCEASLSCWWNWYYCTVIKARLLLRFTSSETKNQDYLCIKKCFKLGWCFLFDGYKLGSLLSTALTTSTLHFRTPEHKRIDDPPRHVFDVGSFRLSHKWQRCSKV